MNNLQLNTAFMDLCVSSRRIAPGKIEQIKTVSAIGGREIYDIILDLHLLSLEQLHAMLSELTRFPVADPLSLNASRPPTRETLNALPHMVALKHCVFPTLLAEGVLHVVMANPADEEVAHIIESLAGVRLRRYVCYYKNILRAVVRSYSYLNSKRFETIVQDGLQEVLGKKQIDPPSSIWTEPLSEALNREVHFFIRDVPSPRQGEVAVTLLVQKIIDNAIYLGASDIHIEPQEDVIKVRFRKDGLLYSKWYIPKMLQHNLLNRLKVMSGMDPITATKPQGGYITYTNVIAVGVDIRASAVPTLHGERFALRLLDKSHTLLAPQNLGMADGALSSFLGAIGRPQGLILVTGPTGCGKTTTIYVALNQLNQDHRAILTIEDPIEYQLMGVGQIQVDAAQQLSFSSVFREVLRQNPDVVLLGEIRDSETAHVAVTAASTGHQVFSTIHATSALGAIPRLLTLGADPFVLADSLGLVVAQRLVRRLCPACKRPDTLSEERLRKLSVSAAELSGGSYSVAAGCDQCNGLGYLGRIGIFELLFPDEPLREMIIERRSVKQMTQHAQGAGMTTLRADGLATAARGVTSLDEVAQATAPLGTRAA